MADSIDIEHKGCVSLVGCVALAHLPSALGNTSHGGHLESRGEVGGGGGKGINETYLPSPGDSPDNHGSATRCWRSALLPIPNNA